MYSTNPDPTQTVVVAGHYNAEPKAMGVSANPCNANLTGTTYGTSGSATFAVFGANFMAENMTFSNNFAEGTTTSGIQAVALETQGDRLIFENVRALGNQDTLYVKTGNVDSVARVYLKSSYVEGDVDFIFGRGTLVLDGCTIQYLSSRRGASNGGTIVSPSTDHRNPFGILIINSQLTAETGTTDHTVPLGRAWDEGSAALPADITQSNPYLVAVAAGGAYTNGQALIRNSTLGAHIQAAPWVAAASSNRPYSSTDVVVTGGTYPANRLFEYANTGAGNGQ
jgi:pectinesterase